MAIEDVENRLFFHVNFHGFFGATSSPPLPHGLPPWEPILLPSEQRGGCLLWLSSLLTQPLSIQWSLYLLIPDALLDHPCRQDLRPLHRLAPQETFSAPETVGVTATPFPSEAVSPVLDC